MLKTSKIWDKLSESIFENFQIARMVTIFHFFFFFLKKNFIAHVWRLLGHCEEKVYFLSFNLQEFGTHLIDLGKLSHCTKNEVILNGKLHFLRRESTLEPFNDLNAGLFQWESSTLTSKLLLHSQ